MWIGVRLKDGRNREVRKVMAHLGLSSHRLIRTAYGPFRIGLSTARIGNGSSAEHSERQARGLLRSTIGAPIRKPELATLSWQSPGSFQRVFGAPPVRSKLRTALGLGTSGALRGPISQAQSVLWKHPTQYAEERHGPSALTSIQRLALVSTISE